MSSFKSIRFIIILLLLIVLVILTRTGCSKMVDYLDKHVADTVYVRDTTWQIRDTVVYKKMIVYETIYHTDTLPYEYTADTNYIKLKLQYDTLVSLFLSRNIYRDTVMIDTIGYVTITDTVQHNILNNRSFTYTYSIPSTIKIVTITEPEIRRNGFYIGGGFNAYRFLVPFSLETGLILKTKQDHIYGLKIGSDINRQFVYGFQSYWKIGNNKN